MTQLFPNRYVQPQIMGRLSTLFPPVLWLLAGLWISLILALDPDWTLNPQYHYGWLVPVLSVILAWRLWDCRPAPVPAKNPPIFPVLLLGLFLLWPLRWLQEANPDWRLLFWIQSLLTIGMTFAVLYFSGGKYWLRHFAPACLFFLIAVPWPFRLETWITQGAMHLVAASTVEVLLWLGIASVQSGNWIEYAHGSIGVSDACSGIRSLQTLLMVSLFLGQFYFLRISRRIALVAWGFLLALLLNFIRTFVLVWLAIRAGSNEAVGHWHDFAGYTTVFLSFGILWWLASRRTPPSPKKESPPSPTPFLFPKNQAIVLFIALAGIHLTVGLWYFLHERNLAPGRIWSVAWPTDANQYHEISAPDTARALLRYDRIQGAGWLSNQELAWSLFLIDYDSGSNSTVMAKVHRPEVCMSSSGLVFLQEFPDLLLPMHQDTLRFRQLLFLQKGVPLHVFYTVWENQADPVAMPERWDWTWQGRFLAAWDGHRNRGQQVIQACILGPVSPEQARQVCSEWMLSHLRLATP